MARTPLQDALDTVVKATTERLAPSGFRRRRLILRQVRGDMCGVVQFQRSTTSTRERLIFTVNIGVVCGALLPSRVKFTEASIPDAHASERLGTIAHGLDDEWWTIDGATDVEKLANEVSDLILHAGVPFIQRYMDPAALVESWESGKSFGLTDMQRRDLLAALKRSLGTPPQLTENSEDS